MTLAQSLQIKPDYLKGTPLHPYVMEKYREYVGTGKYPYLADVVRYILAELPEHSDKADVLKTQVYFAADVFRKEQEDAYAAEMTRKGWVRLEPDIVRQAFEQKKKVIWHRRSTGILGSSQDEIKCRPFVDAAGDIFLLPPRARRRGYLVRTIVMGEEKPQYIKVQP